ncbi:hypothetical protein N9Y42_10385, partial [Mariniblastus sp.]|nr:hypothetical protein [Mariniblastus sp.]
KSHTMNLFTLIVAAVAMTFISQLVGPKPVLAVQPELQDIASAENVFAIYTTNSGFASDGSIKLVSAVWPDGKCICSNDYINGGEPFRHYQLNPDKVKLFLSRIESDELLGNSNLQRPRVSPDAPYTTILVRVDGRQLKMSSTHEQPLSKHLSNQVQSVGQHHVPAMQVPSNQNLDPKPLSSAPPLVRNSRIEQVKNMGIDDMVHRIIWGELRTRFQAMVPIDSDPASSPLAAENRGASPQLPQQQIAE